jgi:hypothetical protein
VLKNDDLELSVQGFLVNRGVVDVVFVVCGCGGIFDSLLLSSAVDLNVDALLVVVEKLKTFVLDIINLLLFSTILQ